MLHFKSVAIFHFNVERMQPHRNKLMKMVVGGEKLSHISLGMKLPLMTKILLEIQFETLS